MVLIINGLNQAITNLDLIIIIKVVAVIITADCFDQEY